MCIPSLEVNRSYNFFTRILQRLFLPLLCLIFSACTQWQTPVEPLLAFEQLLAEQEFVKAESLLTSVSAEHPDYQRLQKRRTELEKKRQVYLESRFNVIAVLKSQYRWQEAEQELKLSAKRVGAELTRQQLELMYEEKRAYLADLQHQAWELAVQNLTRELELYQQQVTAEPSWSNKQVLGVAEKRRDKILQGVEACVENAHEQQLRNEEKRCLLIGIKLEPRQAWQQRLQLVNGKTASIKKPVNKKLSALKTTYREAMQVNDLLQARMALIEMQRYYGKEETVQQFTREFAPAKQAYISREMQRAQGLYSSGKVQAAQQIWEYLLQLDPNNREIKERLERAEHFLNKLESLKATQ